MGKWLCKGTFGLKWGFRGNEHARGTFGLKMVFWGKWACKGTFELKLGFGGSGCPKGLLGKIGVLGEMGMQRNI